MKLNRRQLLTALGLAPIAVPMAISAASEELVVAEDFGPITSPFTDDIGPGVPFNMNEEGGVTDIASMFANGINAHFQHRIQNSCD